MSKNYFVGDKEYFAGIGKIQYEGKESKNPLAFKFYQADKKVGNKTMAEHLRYAACYWHSFCGDGSDPFGLGSRTYPWNSTSDAMTNAQQKQDAAFEFFTKLGVPYYCFHDRDIAPEGVSVIESEKNLFALVESAKQKQDATGIKLLWGTANLFGNKRYMNGASTNPNFDVVAHGGAQVKAALDATVLLGGENYVFWGGREGYMSLLNTSTKREQAHFAKFLMAARDYGRSIGFKGTFLIEPKPMEPTKHQYDFDAQTVIGFLRHHDLDGDFKLNIEANHATLAGHSFEHELQMCADADLLGSIDANRGDPQNGWDTDQFPVDLYDAAKGMLVVLEAGGFKTGGLNFDAKVRRESVDAGDLFAGHIGGMDTFACGLEIAHKIISDGALSKPLKTRYSSFDSGLGKEFAAGNVSLAALRDHAAKIGEPEAISGKQEQLENILNGYMLTSV